MMVAMYSASHKLSATMRCFCDCQLIALDPSKKMTSVVLLRVSRSPAMSLSLKPISRAMPVPFT